MLSLEQKKHREYGPYNYGLGRSSLGYALPKAQGRRRTRLLGTAVVLSLMLSPVAMQSEVLAAGTITRINDTKTNLMVSGKAEIYPEVIDTAKKTGLNRFQQFQVGAGDIANLYLHNGKTGKELHSVNTLINAVNSKIDVQGTVNAIRSTGKIGGNLIFLSSSGMVVGAQGAINAGSLMVQAPTSATFSEAYIDKENKINLFANSGKTVATTEQVQKFLTYNAEAIAKGQIKAADKDVVIPLNSEGSIEVKGNINAAVGIMLKAAQVKLAKGGTVRSGVDFSSIENVGSASQTAITDDYFAGHKLAVEQKFEEKEDPETKQKYTVEYFVLTDPSDSAKDNVVTGDGSVALDAGIDAADDGVDGVEIASKEVTATVEEGAKITALTNITVGANTSMGLAVTDEETSVYFTSATNTATTNVNGTLTSEKGDITVNATAGMEASLDKVVLTDNTATVTVGSKAKFSGRNVSVNSKAEASVSGEPSVFIKGSNTSLAQVDDSASFTASQGVQILAENETNLSVGGGIIPGQGLKTNVILYDITSKAEVKNLDTKDTSPAATWQADTVEVKASNTGSSDGLAISNYSVKKTSDDTSKDEGNRNGVKVRDKVLNEDGTVTSTERDLGKTYIDSTGKRTEGDEAVPNPEEDPEEEEEMEVEQEEKEVEQGSKIGLNYAGSVIWQDLAYSTVANVENVTLNLVGSTKKVSVNAEDTASISALAGAIAVTREKIDTKTSDYKTTLAGDVAVNDVTKNTSSTLKGVTINDASQVDNQALNMGSQVASALALGREVGARTQSTYANIAATGSVNLIDSKVTAKITGSKINEQSAGGVVNNVAYDKDLQSAGGASIDYARSYASTGASVSVNRAWNTITALIEKSTLGSSTNALGALTNYAASNLTQTGSAISLGIIPPSQSEKTYSTVNGAIAVNTLTNTLDAKVKGSTVYSATATIAAKDGKLAGTEEEENPEVEKYQNMKTDNGTAIFDIKGKQVTSAVNSNNVEMVVNEKGEAQKTDAGAVQYKASAAQVETAGNNITGSAINLVLNMQKEAVGNFTGGASVVYNKIKDDYQANVDSSTIVTAAGGSSEKPTFTVEAQSSTSIVGLAAGIALRTSKATAFAAEAAGSVVNQNVTNTIKASVTGDSKITADYSAISALNNDVLFAVGGLIQVAQVNLGLGMTWTQNRLNNVTGAYVDNATFAAATSGSGAELSALADNNTTAIAIAGALDVTATVGEKLITVVG